MCVGESEDHLRNSPIDEGVQLVLKIEPPPADEYASGALALKLPHSECFYRASQVIGRVIPIHAAVWKDADSDLIHDIVSLVHVSCL